jgi:hypothetical protein
MFISNSIILSILMSKSKFRFWFRLFTCDEIEIPKKFHLISSKFRCRSRNFDFGFDVEIGLSVSMSWIGISITTSEFRFGTRFQNQCRNFKAFFIEISHNSDYFRKFRPIISPKVEINFWWKPQAQYSSLALSFKMSKVFFQIKYKRKSWNRFKIFPI